MPQPIRLGAPAHSFLAALAGLALLGSLASAPAPALATAGSAASSASQSVGFSIGSISGSLRTSSGSSPNAADVAAADYEVMTIVAVDDRPDWVRMTLRAPVEGAAPAAELVLELPRQAVDRGRLAAGRTVSARHRPYGIEFASGEPREAFFLVLDDDWYRELHAHAVAS